jgi:hypothetical protein
MRVSRFLPNPNSKKGKQGEVRPGLRRDSRNLISYLHLSLRLGSIISLCFYFFSPLFGKRENHSQISHVLENPWLRSPRTKRNPLLRRRCLPLLSKICSLPLASTSNDPISNKRPKSQIKVQSSLSRSSPSPNSSVYLFSLNV